MTDPVIAAKEPFEKVIKAGERYAWCACGLSKQQPVCDGSHKVTDLRPMIKVAEKDETIWLCGCKQSGTKPYCDGTHNSL